MRGGGPSVTELLLDTQVDVTVARWGGSSHLTLWASPDVLLAAVVDVAPVRQ
jgi:hypothetical protein